MKSLDIKEAYSKLFVSYFDDVQEDGQEIQDMIHNRLSECRDCIHYRKSGVCKLNSKACAVFVKYPFNECPDLLWDAILNVDELKSIERY